MSLERPRLDVPSGGIAGARRGRAEARVDDSTGTRDRGGFARELADAGRATRVASRGESVARPEARHAMTGDANDVTKAGRASAARSSDRREATTGADGRRDADARREARVLDARREARRDAVAAGHAGRERAAVSASDTPRDARLQGAEHDARAASETACPDMATAHGDASPAATNATTGGPGHATVRCGSDRNASGIAEERMSAARDNALPSTSVETAAACPRRRDDLPPADTAASLPDAMLALLGVELPGPAPTPPPLAAVHAHAPAGGAATRSLAALALHVSTTTDATPAGAASSSPLAAATAAGALQPTTSLTTSALDAATSLAAALALPTAASSRDPGAPQGPGSDAVASLLAVTEPRDIGTSETTGYEGASAVAALAGRGTAETIGATRAAVVLPAVPMPVVPEDGFDDGFGDRIVWMAEQRLGHAELRVSPDGVGAIDIRLQVDGNRVSAQFNAANPDVRQALESGMDRLRDLLGHHGMELARSDVGGGRQRRDGDAPPDMAAGDADTAPVTTTIRGLRARGLVDEYA